MHMTSRERICSQTKPSYATRRRTTVMEVWAGIVPSGPPNGSANCIYCWSCHPWTIGRILLCIGKWVSGNIVEVSISIRTLALCRYWFF
jgi:hypothetical protein